MAYSLKLNGFLYQDTDFLTDNYAQNFNKAIGDFYEHCTRVWYANGSFTNDTTFSTLSWNAANSSQVFAVGSNVVIFSRSKPSAYRTYASIASANFSSGNWVYTLTVNAQIGGLPSASGISDWTMTPTGLQSVNLGGTLQLSGGGTGATTAAGALVNLGLISPAVFMQLVNEDFISYATYTTDPNDCGWFANMGGYVNFAGHTDQAALDRFPGVKLNNHPGIAHLYVAANGSSATYAMRGAFNDTMPNGLIFAGVEAVFEIMFRINGPSAGNPGEFSLRMGLTDTLTDGAGNEVGIGIRPFLQNGLEPNILRVYSCVGGIYKMPTAGGSPYTGEMPLNTWIRAVLTRFASGNMTGALYFMDEDGTAFTVAGLGSITAANLPTVGLRPFLRLDRRMASTGAVEMLIDYHQVYRRLSR